jgi:hypothetical protein
MACIKVDPGKVHEFEDGRAFYAWLGKAFATAALGGHIG